MAVKGKSYLVSKKRIEELTTIHAKYFATSCGVVASSAFVTLISVPVSAPATSFDSLDWDRVHAILVVGAVMLLIQASIIYHYVSDLITSQLVAKADVLSKVKRNGLVSLKTVLWVSLVVLLVFLFNYVRTVNPQSGPAQLFHILGYFIAGELLAFTAATIYYLRVQFTNDMHRKKA
jgi:hypothetical protein